jgi:hypothetical protein
VRRVAVTRHYGPVQRRLAFLVVWSVVTAVTVGASWLGIRSVLFAAAPSRTTPLSAADLRKIAPTPSDVAPRITTPPPSPTPTPSRTWVATHPTTPSLEWSPTPDGHGGTTFRATIKVLGGETTVLCGPSGASVVTMKPAKGYTAMQNQFNQRSVTVTFVSEKHYSRVTVIWRSGQGAPQAELTESAP